MAVDNGSTGAPIRVLLLEDSDIDAEIVKAHLGRMALNLAVNRAVDRAEFLGALAGAQPDIILADYSLPDFDGLSALTLARAAVPDVPFLFVSGVVGEEFATGALQRGATDYVMKRNLGRLATAVERALAEAHERSERLRAEAALQTSEINTRLAVEAAGLGMWEFHPQTGELTWDARSKALFGLRPNDDLSLPAFIAAVNPDHRERVETALAGATAGEPRVVSGKFRITTPGGGQRWLAARGQGLFADGRCVRLVGVLRDVTDEKRAEERLRELNLTLEARVAERTRERDRIWLLSQDLFAVSGFDGYLTTVNPAWERVLGYDEGTLLAKPFATLIHPDDLDAAAEVVAALRRGEPTVRFQDRLRCRDGSYRWISWTAVPAGDVFYSVGRDVTEEKEAARELAAANRQLLEQIAEREKVEDTLNQMQRLEAVGQLTSGVAHDFNNLLTVILGNVGFLEKAFDKTGLDGKMKQRLSHMRVAAERGAKLTSQLLAFSRRQRLEPKPVDLNDTVANMRDLLQSTMGGSVRLETVLKPELWPALVDPTQIELIILNLAINARDAMEVGGSLTVETANVVLRSPPQRLEEPAPGEYVMLSVADSGTGMSDEVLAKAFEPFFTTKPVGKGSGLGLAQVYGFAKQSGGGVRIETRLGEGTCIKVYLPRAASSAAPDQPLGADRAWPRGHEQHKLAILLVEDDAAVREVTSAILQDLGYAVHEAGSAGAALDHLDRERDVDLLLVDYAMPGMNGAETAAEARRRRPNLPVLFITGYADLAALKDVGEQRVVQKPFRNDDLAAKVAAALAPAAREKTATVLPLMRRG